MKRDDLRPDEALRDMLRRFDAPERVSADQRAALLRRIAVDAEPLLTARRSAAPAWWEFTAGWARMLIPAGVATAVVAAGLMLWSAHTAQQSTLMPLASRNALVSSLPRDRTSQRLLDVLVSPLALPGDDALPAGPRHP